MCTHTYTYIYIYVMISHVRRNTDLLCSTVVQKRSASRPEPLELPQAKLIVCLTIMCSIKSSTVSMDNS